MPAAAPTVSIVIPAYRKAATLARALQSVVNQSYRDFELHVVDDSGNEDLRPLVARYAVTSYTPQNCQGPGAARNRGLALCTGRYVISLDHDDEWDPDFLERAIQAIHQSKRAMESGLSLELPAVDLHIAANALGEIVGKSTSEDLLDSIFSQFCIGK